MRMKWNRRVGSGNDGHLCNEGSDVTGRVWTSLNRSARN